MSQPIKKKNEISNFRPTLRSKNYFSNQIWVLEERKSYLGFTREKKKLKNNDHNLHRNSDPRDVMRRPKCGWKKSKRQANPWNNFKNTGYLIEQSHPDKDISHPNKCEKKNFLSHSVMFSPWISNPDQLYKVHLRPNQSCKCIKKITRATWACRNHESSLAKHIWIKKLKHV